MLLVDGDNLVRRCIMAAAKHDRKSGKWIGGVRSSFTLLQKAMYVHDPSRVVVAFDYGCPAFRKQIFPEYKADRKARSDLTGEERELAYQQVDTVRELLPLLGATVVRFKHHEADDLLASMVQVLSEVDRSCIVASSDKDLWQVLAYGKGVSIYDFGAKCRIDRRDLKKRFGVPASDYLTFRALVGDPSDNLPGVRGIGESRAAKLLQFFRVNDSEWSKLSEPIHQLEYMRDALAAAPKEVLQAYERDFLEQYESAAKTLAVMNLEHSTNLNVQRSLRDIVLEDVGDRFVDRRGFLKAGKAFGLVEVVASTVEFFEPFEGACNVRG